MLVLSEDSTRCMKDKSGVSLWLFVCSVSKSWISLQGATAINVAWSGPGAPPAPAVSGQNAEVVRTDILFKPKLFWDVHHLRASAWPTTNSDISSEELHKLWLENSGGFLRSLSILLNCLRCLSEGRRSGKRLGIEHKELYALPLHRQETAICCISRLLKGNRCKTSSGKKLKWLNN